MGRPKKTTKIEGENNELLNTEILENVEQQKGDTDDLNEAFNEFEKTTSGFTPEQEAEETTTEETTTGEAKTEPVELTFEQKTKLKMFVGFACFVLSGLNMFLLNKVRKSNVPFKKMILEEHERDSIMPYMESPEIIAFIDKLPTWLIAVAHIEYIYIQKHSEFSDEYKIIEVEEVKTEKEKTTE